jgi:DnaJ-class molecular chaperone
MKVQKSFYDVLELGLEANQQQIKTNYRRLAKKYHPDLNPGNPRAVENFRVVQEAYETLGDPQKRREYDATIKPKGSARNGSQEDDDDWFGVGSMAAQARPRDTRPNHPTQRGMSKPHLPRQSYLRYTIKLTLRELFKGAIRTLNVGQTHTCARCKGSRVAPETGKPCPRCEGYGFLVAYEIVDVTVPPGLLPGMSLRVEMRHWVDRDQHPLHMPYTTGIFVTIEVLPDETFSIEGLDLYTTLCIPREMLNSGGQFTVKAPEGGELPVKIPPHTLNGEVIKLKSYGLLKGSSHRRGNLFCKIMAQE